MHAAVVTSFDEPPVFGEFPVPTTGSGQGSVSTAALLAELPALAEEIASGAMRIMPARSRWST